MYRVVTMVELREVLRLWREGLPKKRLAAQLGLDPKTVRRYLAAAVLAGREAARLRQVVPQRPLHRRRSLCRRPSTR